MKIFARNFISATLVAVGLGATVSAQAGYVDFTLNGVTGSAQGTQTSNVLTDVVSAYSVAIKPYVMNLGASTPAWTSLLVTGTSLTNDLRVSRNNAGLGVNQPGGGDNANQIDSYGSSVEGLLFDFGTASWAALEVSLRGLNTQDRFDAWVGDSFDGSSAVMPLAQLAGGVLTGSIYSIADFGHRYLFIAAREDGNTGVSCRNDNANTVATRANCFQIDNIRAIPEPTSMAMMGLGLLAMGGVLRRRIAGS